jgi:hypothetical protein
MAHVSRRLAIVAVAFALLAVSSPAWAHVGAPIVRGESAVATELGPEALRASAPTSASPWLLAAGAVVLLALTLRRRGALALALLVLLICGVFEAGMHSVHHLTEADAAKCAVAAISSHAGGVVPATIAVERPADIATAAVPSHVAAFAPSRLSAPDLGRAPPAAV